MSATPRQSPPPSAPQIRVLTGPMRTFNITASGGNDRVVATATSTTTDRVLVTSTGAESVQVSSQFGSSTDRTLETDRQQRRLARHRRRRHPVLDDPGHRHRRSAGGGGNTRILISDDAQFNQIVGVSLLTTSDTVVVMPPTVRSPPLPCSGSPAGSTRRCPFPPPAGGGPRYGSRWPRDIDYVDLNGFTNVSVDWSASLAALDRHHRCRERRVPRHVSRLRSEDSVHRKQSLAPR